MARKPRSEEHQEAEVSYEPENATVEDGMQGVQLINPAPLYGNAVARQVERAEVTAHVAAHPKRYIVERGGFVMVDSFKTNMKPGKVIVEGQYDIGRLIAQGIQLRELSSQLRGESWRFRMLRKCGFVTILDT